jgi:signal transduction histidine kinase
MNSLISELLNLARIESGQMHFQYQNLNLGEFIEKQKGKFQPMSAEKNQQLIFSVSPKLVFVKTDPLRIEQILSNLISNALRHSPDGNKIFIQFERDKTSFILSVTDSGEGIPKKDLPYLWDRFYRVDKARSRNKGGTGLGLAITKKLVEGMHGSISVSSIPNEKTIFKVIFPKTF